MATEPLHDETEEITASPSAPGAGAGKYVDSATIRQAQERSLGGKLEGMDALYHSPPTETQPVEPPPVEQKPKTKLTWPICKCDDDMECYFQKDGSWRLVKVIAIRRNDRGSGKGQQIEYYVRFKDFDKRLDEWVTKERLKKPSPKTLEKENNRRATRGQKRGFEETALTPQQIENEEQHEELNKMRNIERVIIGGYNLKTWYFSPYPEKYNRPGGTMFVCEYCLKYMQRGSSLRNHLSECRLRHPPGDEIYRHDGVSIFEVDGELNKVYCQNLCLFCKLFLDHKTLYFGVAPFLFYIVCEYDSEGYHIVGFFSKEKSSSESFNLACILAFPYHQRCGWGRFLISLSYELTKREQKTGSPEKPLSDLGLKAYRSYWAYEILKILDDKNCNVHVKEISRQTGIMEEDVRDTLELLNLYSYNKKNYTISQDKLPIVRKLFRECVERRQKRPAKKEFTPPQLHWQRKPADRPRRAKRQKTQRYGS